MIHSVARYRVLWIAVFFCVIAILPGVLFKNQERISCFSYVYQMGIESACNQVMPIRQLGQILEKAPGEISEEIPKEIQKGTPKEIQFSEKEPEGQEIVKDPVDVTLWEEGNKEEPTALFRPHTRQFSIDWSRYQDYEKLVGDFYTIDASTYGDEALLNAHSLMEKDLTLPEAAQNQEKSPSVLIYHTHSLENFADSDPDNPETGIVGVGERLAEILRSEYGYRVLHCRESFDAVSRDGAYSKALPYLEKLLEENPSIQVVIDLHRDDVPKEQEMTVDLDGRPTAKFMFFNGVSCLKKSGKIEYLKNENLQGNLAFSLQMKAKCEEYYPGLTRKIYLKGYRYNLHLKERSLLVELGANHNTVQEAMNACDPLAHVLHMVLQGET